MSLDSSKLRPAHHLFYETSHGLRFTAIRYSGNELWLKLNKANTGDCELIFGPKQIQELKDFLTHAENLLGPPDEG